MYIYIFLTHIYTLFVHSRMLAFSTTQMHDYTTKFKSQHFKDLFCCWRNNDSLDLNLFVHLFIIECNKLFVYLKSRTTKIICFINYFSHMGYNIFKSGDTETILKKYYLAI